MTDDDRAVAAFAQVGDAARYIVASIERGKLTGDCIPRYAVTPRLEDWWPRTAGSLAAAQLKGSEK